MSIYESRYPQIHVASLRDQGHFIHVWPYYEFIHIIHTHHESIWSFHIYIHMYINHDSCIWIQHEFILVSSDCMPANPCHFMMSLYTLSNQVYSYHYHDMNQGVPRPCSWDSLPPGLVGGCGNWAEIVSQCTSVTGPWTRNGLSNSPRPLGRARGRGQYFLLARAIKNLNKPFQCSNGGIPRSGAAPPRG